VPPALPGKPARRPRNSLLRNSTDRESAVRLPTPGGCGEQAQVGLNDRRQASRWANGRRAGPGHLRANATDGQTAGGQIIARGAPTKPNRVQRRRRGSIGGCRSTRLQPPWAGHPTGAGWLHLVATLASRAAGPQRLPAATVANGAAAASRSWGVVLTNPCMPLRPHSRQPPATSLFVGAWIAWWRLVLLSARLGRLARPAGSHPPGAPSMPWELQIALNPAPSPGA